jgi:hypothetical protein
MRHTVICGLPRSTIVLRIIKVTQKFVKVKQNKTKQKQNKTKTKVKQK